MSKHTERNGGVRTRTWAEMNGGHISNGIVAVLLCWLAVAVTLWTCTTCTDKRSCGACRVLLCSRRRQRRTKRSSPKKEQL